MTSLKHMTIAKRAFICWAASWVSFAFVPSRSAASSASEIGTYLLLTIWIVSYWVLHIFLAMGKGYPATTGVGHAFFPILGLVVLALKKDRLT